MPEYQNQPGLPRMTQWIFLHDKPLNITQSHQQHKISVASVLGELLLILPFLVALQRFTGWSTDAGNTEESKKEELGG